MEATSSNGKGNVPKVQCMMTDIFRSLNHLVLTLSLGGIYLTKLSIVYYSCNLDGSSSSISGGGITVTAPPPLMTKMMIEVKKT